MARQLSVIMEAGGDEEFADGQNIQSSNADVCPSEPRDERSNENMDVDEEGLFKHSTTLTNKQRGNEVTVRPATLDSLSIHQLAAQGDVTQVAAHLCKDSSLLSRQDERGFTPLMWAAAFGEKAVVDYLLEKGADPNAIARERESALTLASSGGYVDIVESLLRHGVDINTYDWVYNDYHHQFRILLVTERRCNITNMTFFYIFGILISERSESVGGPYSETLQAANMTLVEMNKWMRQSDTVDLRSTTSHHRR
ncbi:DNA-binding protein RFXANK [Larimichthys crocea]|uniref:Uncharacterized protein n=1 Tax=Larimichthys crocea TaxID=215358 RepID=A0ACD3RMS5_LARCR|nr:DNA-binding protein RFXANK [Larimichthys crocea]